MKFEVNVWNVAKGRTVDIVGNMNDGVMYSKNILIGVNLKKIFIGLLG